MILRHDDITAAADNGIITAEQGRALEEFAAKRRARPRASNERFVVVNNFAEVFICVGQIMAASAVSSYAGLTGNAAAIYLAVAAAGWLMAEYFTYRRPRLAPAVLASLMAAYFTLKAFLAWNAGDFGPDGIIDAITGRFDAATIAFLALLGTFARFRLPFLLLPMGLVFAAASLQAAATLLPEVSFYWVLAGCGILLLSLAVWLDSFDPLRQSRINDFAFWLFVLGSPMTIHPLFASAILTSSDWGRATLLVAGCAIATSLLGLVLDRRSLIASSLIYITVAIGYGSFDIVNLGVLGPVFFAPMIVGTGIILLGTFWYPVRSALLKPFAAHPLLRHVPPL